MDNADVKGKMVIVRVDINSPIDPNTGALLDDTRIRECAPTLKELAMKGARVVVLAHQGRPGDDDFTTLEKHAQRLSQVLGLQVMYIPDVVGPSVIHMLRLIRPGDVALIENVRMLAEETAKLSPEQQANTHLVRQLKSIGNLYVNDAFGAIHRSSPSLVGFAEVLPSYAGRLMERELKSLGVALFPERPCVYVLGGAKFDDSLKIADHVLSKGTADYVLTGGLVSLAFLAAMGIDIGKPNIEFLKSKGYDKEVERAKRLLQQHGDRIMVPIDLVVEQQGEPRLIQVEESLTGLSANEVSRAMQQGTRKSGLPTELRIWDLGPRTVEGYSRIIMQAKTVIANGPLGVFEKAGFEHGTFGVLRAMAESPAFTIIGGGHIVAATSASGLAQKMKHVSTGGGAAISLLAGDSLPVVEALTRAAERVKPSKPAA